MLCHLDEVRLTGNSGEVAQEDDEQRPTEKSSEPNRRAIGTYELKVGENHEGTKGHRGDSRGNWLID